MADRAQATRAKWRPYAGVGPAGQAIVDTTTPRACWPAYLFRLRRVSPRLFARTEPQPLAIAGRASAITSLSRHCKNAVAS